MLLIVLLIVLFLMMVWAIENHSKEKAERMTYLDIHIYKRHCEVCLSASD